MVSGHKSIEGSWGSAGVGCIALSIAIALAGCAGHRPPPPADTAAVTQPRPTPNLSFRKRYELVLQLMQFGNEPQAHVELTALGLERPDDRRVAMLLRQLDNDPRQLFGADNFAYTLKPGDTLFSLARRYLGDSLNFYGLAKYNGLTLPAALKPGSSLQIPGHAPEMVAPPPRRRRIAKPSAPAGQPPAPAAAAAEPAVDHGRAQRLRQEGLEQMSAGSIDRAVMLLSQAASLDPQDGAISADLAKARRIQATVRAH